MTLPTASDVVHVAPGSEELNAVYRLYRANSKTLGFLPRGAFEEFAREGRVLALPGAGGLVGYLAFRVAGNEGVVVHLCVEEQHRGGDWAAALMEKLLEETADLSAVRLSCREDYPANKVWPRFQFHCVGERPGRGQDGGSLFLWRRQNGGGPPLLALIKEAQRRDRTTLAVDANVFFDFQDAAPRAEESKSLLADWLEDEVAVCVTAELLNEISRRDDQGEREWARRQASCFTKLEGRPNAVRALCLTLQGCLPPARREADRSDRRQLAHAAAERADFFVTRDALLLAYADAIEAAIGVPVVRPSDLIIRLHADGDEPAYSPARIVGTAIIERKVKSEAEVAPFQRFGQGETKADWLGRCRPALSRPDQVEVVLVGPRGEPAHLLYAVAGVEDKVLDIPILRTHSHRTAGTLLRRVLSETLARAQREGRTLVTCSDIGDKRVDDALQELGFSSTTSGYSKVSIKGLIDADQVQAHLGRVPHGFPGRAASGGSSAIERQCWPLKIADGGLDSFVVPIWPLWASHLFDAEIASRSLFGADPSRALALENVYYSASPITIPPGSRILWYVSGRGRDAVQQVRACSLCLETVRAPARDLYRRFNRLGIYRWPDVLKRAKGDPHRSLTAYRFEFTERFERPVSWARLQALLRLHTGKGNPIAGPVRLPNKVFLDLYREGVALDG